MGCLLKIKTLNHIKDLGYTKFSYTEQDDCKFEEELSWENFEFSDILIPHRKSLWGIVYFKC
jgi:hypothetical protein